MPSLPRANIILSAIDSAYCDVCYRGVVCLSVWYAHAPYMCGHNWHCIRVEQGFICALTVLTYLVWRRYAVPACSFCCHNGGTLSTCEVRNVKNTKLPRNMYVSWAKMHQPSFSAGSLSRRDEGAYNAPPNLLVGWGGMSPAPSYFPLPCRFWHLDFVSLRLDSRYTLRLRFTVLPLRFLQIN